MDLNPNTRGLREGLLSHGIGYELDDGEDETEDGFRLHVERTAFVTRGGVPVEVLYGWTRDEDGMRMGVSAGYPAYLECTIGDGRQLMATVEEVLAVALS